MKEIDELVNIQTHRLLEITAPHSYKSYWGNKNPRSVFNADYLTRIFLVLLAALWTAAFAIALLPPGLSPAQLT
jgi:hypothetical protein